MLEPFPALSRVRWRRLDVPGHEEALVRRVASGWRLSGALDVEEAGQSIRLRYEVECDPSWRTRSALVDGAVDRRPIRFALETDGAGHWTGDRASAAVNGAVDIDLGFTPATNTLPIRRLDLPVGGSAPVRSAWLRFPELRLEPLDQVYMREAAGVFRYRADVNGELFAARLDVDAFGRVVTYEGLWQAERMEPAGA